MTTGESLSHQAYLALENLIVTLKLKPGSLVTEKQLLDMTGQGRTPVREAIQKLSWQGLIVVRPRVGLQIAEIGPDDSDHVMRVRAEIEPMAAGLVARHANAEQRAALLACAQTMTACAVSGDMASFLAADKTFDEILEDACPNRFLTSALAPLQTHARRVWFSAATHERMDRSISLHVTVIRAIQQGDPDKAAKAMSNLVNAMADRG